MDNQKNLLLAIVISMAIIFGFQLLIPQPEKPVIQPENTQANNGVDLDTPNSTSKIIVNRNEALIPEPSSVL